MTDTEAVRSIGLHPIIGNFILQNAKIMSKNGFTVSVYGCIQNHDIYFEIRKKNYKGYIDIIKYVDRPIELGVNVFLGASPIHKDFYVHRRKDNLILLFNVEDGKFF